MADAFKHPATRQAELHYYTKTRQDTWRSTTTVIDADVEPTQLSGLHGIRTVLARRWQSVRTCLSNVLLASQTRWRRSRQHLSSLCRDWWLIELISWCLAAFCMVCIATLLAAFNGRPLPDQFPLGLKLNAYVSVLAAVSKLAMAVCLEEALATQKYLWFTTRSPQHSLLDFERFEIAARRPIGAVKLIWHMKLK